MDLNGSLYDYVIHVALISRFLLGTGGMLHPVGGAMGMSLFHADVMGIHLV